MKRHEQQTQGNGGDQAPDQLLVVALLEGLDHLLQGALDLEKLLGGEEFGIGLLHDLQLRSHLSKNTPAKEGVPVTLTLELKARGATGEQLPSLEGLLKSDFFRA